jgi:hypothetical protein
MGAHEMRSEHAVLGQSGHDGRAPAPLALDRLDFGLGQMRVDADAVLMGEPRAAVEKLVGSLIRNRRRHRDAYAALGGAVPAADDGLREVEQSLGGCRLHRLHDGAQVGRQQVEHSRDGAVEHDVGDGRREHRA